MPPPGPAAETPDEAAAVLALMRRAATPWNRVAGAIEEAGSARALLAPSDATHLNALFPDTDVDGLLESLRAEIAAWATIGIDLVTVLDPTYPINLRMVHDRPPALFIRGALQERDERSIAVVGSRRASPEGIATARDITRDLVDEGYVVVSGLAAGIDSAAHGAALEAGGRTVAVIGTGLNHAYPAQNAQLQATLARDHAVISQFWPDQGPRRWTFPQRNAVMSGFARATVVVEAGETSGARIQARLAFEHGRPVFLLDSLLTLDWAKRHAERPGTYVVSAPDQILTTLARLYDTEPLLTA